MSDNEVATIEPQTNGGAKRGRGRPKKDPNAPPPKVAKHVPTNNGDATNGSIGKRGRKPREVTVAAPVVAAPKSGPSGGAKRGRGRPPKSASKGKAGGKKRGRKPGPKKPQLTSDSADEEPVGDDSAEDERDGHDEEED